jgi:hypothetical protein
MQAGQVALAPPISMIPANQHISHEHTDAAVSVIGHAIDNTSPQSGYTLPGTREDPFAGSPIELSLGDLQNRHARANNGDGVDPFTASPTAITAPSHEPFVGGTTVPNVQARDMYTSTNDHSGGSHSYPPNGLAAINYASTSEAPLPPPRPHPKSLSAYLAAHPDATAKKAISKTYPKPNPLIRLARRFSVRHSVIHGLTKEQMKKREEHEGASKRAQAGWRLAHEPEVAADGSRRVLVSELFWKIYLSILPTLERDPLSGLVAPPLLGSTTTMPLSIISLIPDIMRHYADVIVRAEKEVFLVTNYWQ